MSKYFTAAIMKSTVLLIFPFQGIFTCAKSPIQWPELLRCRMYRIRNERIKGEVKVEQTRHKKIAEARLRWL